jgi:hypothetical protein
MFCRTSNSLRVGLQYRVQIWAKVIVLQYEFSVEQSRVFIVFLSRGIILTLSLGKLSLQILVEFTTPQWLLAI